jgi:hypothetical protein
MTRTTTVVLSLLALWVGQGAGAGAGGLAGARLSLGDASYIQALPARLLACLSQGSGAPSAGAGAGAGAEAEAAGLLCRTASYVEQVQQLLADATATPSTGTAAVGKIEFDANEYPSQFEQKIAKNM